MDNFDITDENIYDKSRASEFLWEKSRALGISRRRLVQLLAAGSSSAAITGLFSQNRNNKAIAQTPTIVTQKAQTQAIVKPAPPENFYQMGSNLEMRWEAMYNRGYLVPNNLFFVRNNSPTPRINPSAYQLKIYGSGVAKPKSFSYDELLAMPSLSVIRAIECAGNGRSFYKTQLGKEARGTQWKLGGIGVAEWTGVPLKEVLERAGLKRTARDVMPISLDEKKVQRPFPIEKALLEDTLLVYAMNGDILPPDHGFPIRTLLPGWVGIANIKWVDGIEVSESPLYSLYNTEKYILIGEDYPVPEELRAKGVLGEIATEQKVKSAFELPWNGEIRGGKQLLRGRSWSAKGKIENVEVSDNGGRNWQRARLREPNIAGAWVRWDIDWDARRGNYSLQARATDNKGNKQPNSVPFNKKGYLYWGVVTHPIKVV
ncbi:MAG: sulfite oxidase [Cyanobacteria bacterium P01_A01_bin.80]